MENIYLIKLWDENESFFKIGTTVHRYCRFYEIIKSGYSVEIVYMLMGLDFYEALDSESELQSMFKQYTPNRKFGGYTECFDNINVSKIKSYLNKRFQEPKEIVENIEITWH